MAFRWADSFDHYASADLLKKWSVIYSGTSVTVDPVIGSANGRHSSDGLQCIATGTTTQARSVGRVVTTSGATAIWGFAFKQSGGGFNDLQSASGGLNSIVQSGGNGAMNMITSLHKSGAAFDTKVCFRINSSGTISAVRPSSSSGGANAIVIGTSTAALVHNAFQFVEFKVVLHSSSGGSIDVWVNGVSIMSLSSVTTSVETDLTWDEIVVGDCRTSSTTDIQWDYDDIYVLDGSGSYNTSRLGDVRVDALYPTADGANTDSTPSTGTTRWDLQDEAEANGDTDYVTLAAANDDDSYVMQDCPVSGVTVHAMQVNHWAKRTAAGSALLKSLVRVSGTDYYGAEQGVSDGYFNVATPYDRSPVDGTTALSTTLIDGAEFGIRKSL